MARDLQLLQDWSEVKQGRARPINHSETGANAGFVHKLSLDLVNVNIANNSRVMFNY